MNLNELAERLEALSIVPAPNAATEAAAVLRSLASVEPCAWIGHCPDGTKLVTTDIAESGRWLDRGDVIVGDLFAAPPIPADKGCARNQGTTQFCAEAVEKDKEIERLKKALERVQPYIEGDMAEVESLRKDAERYRWLRTRMTWRHESRGTASNRTSPPIHYSVRVWYHETSDQEHDTIDAAIDAALGKSK